MSSKQALAGLVSLCLSFGPAIAGPAQAAVKVVARTGAQPSVPGARVAPVPISIGGASANPLGSLNVSLTSDLRSISHGIMIQNGVRRVEVLPSGIHTVRNGGGISAAVSVENTAAVDDAPRLQENGSVAEGSAGTPIEKVSTKVGKGLNLPGLKTPAGVETSRSSAESLFASLLDRRLIKGRGAVRPSARYALGKVRGTRHNHLKEPGEQSPDSFDAEPPQPEPSSEKTPFWKKSAVRKTAAVLGAAALVGIGTLAVVNPALLGAIVGTIFNAEYVGAAGSLLLGALGMPQIIKNFKYGKKATQDVPIGWPRLWFPMAVMFSIASIGGGANFWWSAVNVAGVLQSATLLAQIHRNHPEQGGRAKTIALVLASLAPIPLVALQLFMPLAGWVNAAFTLAIYMCWIVNWPQVTAYNQTYRKEKRRPDGLAPLTPGLVAIGSILHLYAALSVGDPKWALNAIIAIAGTSIVVGQYYFPKFTNTLVGPLVRLYEKGTALAAKAKDVIGPRLKRAVVSVKKRLLLPKARRIVRELFKDADYSGFARGNTDAQIAKVIEMAEELPGGSVIYFHAPTAAGKSTLAKSLESVLTDRIKVFPVDSYFKSITEMDAPPGESVDWDQPNALHLDRAARDIKALLAGERIELPFRDMTTQTTHWDTGDYMRLDEDDLLVVDSIYALHDKLNDASAGRQTLKVFMHAPAAARHLRRILRDLEERGRSIRDNIEPWPTILKDEKEFILPLSRYADVSMTMTGAAELAALEEKYTDLLAEYWAVEGRTQKLTDLFVESIRGSIEADKEFTTEHFADAMLQRQLPKGASYLSPAAVEDLKTRLNLTTDELLVHLLPMARRLAKPDITGTAHGAAALGESGAIYLGGNVETFAGGVQLNTHAEQAATANALARGEKVLKSLAISGVPCGACLQFLSELVSAKSIRILVGSAVKVKTLADLIPDPYGGTGSLGADRDNGLSLIGSGTELGRAALAAANKSHAKHPAGIALRTADGKIYQGSFIDIRGHAHNLRPIEAALLSLLADGKSFDDIVGAAIVELEDSKIQHEALTRNVLADIAPAARLEVLKASENPGKLASLPLEHHGRGPRNSSITA